MPAVVHLGAARKRFEEKYRLYGTGDPSAAGGVDAPIGAEFFRLDGGIGGMKYYKYGLARTAWYLSGGVPGAGTMLYAGNGSPEGVVTAGVSSIYLQLNADDSATADVHPIWVKVQGSGNTGWQRNGGFGNPAGDRMAIATDWIMSSIPDNTLQLGGGGGGADENRVLHHYRFGEETLDDNLPIDFYFPHALLINNRSGVPVTIKGSRARGTGTPGTIKFQLSTPTTSGTTLQALIDILTLAHDKITFHKNVEFLSGGGSGTATERTSVVQQLIKNAGAATIRGVGLADPTLTGAVDIDGTYGRYVAFDTTAVLNNVAGISPVSLGRYDFNGDHTITGRTSASITLIRLWAGLSSASLSAKDTPTTESVAAFRFSTAAGDANWQCVSHDGGGGAATVTNSGVAVATTTQYRFRIVRLSSGNIEFYINDALVATHTTQLPAGAIVSQMVFSVTTLSAAIRTFSFSRAAFIYADK